MNREPCSNARVQLDWQHRQGDIACNRADSDPALTIRQQGRAFDPGRQPAQSGGSRRVRGFGLDGGPRHD